MPNNLSEVALGGNSPKSFVWTLEIEPFSTFSYSVMRQNVLSLCIEDQFKSQRDAIIYMKAPVNPPLSYVNDLHRRFNKELSVLNEEQRAAVLKSILSRNYHMVLGTPGSGKTTAIVVLLRILAAMKKRVLVVSFTNSAIDNVLTRLKNTGFENFVRVTNNMSSVEEQVQGHVKTY